jgi:hypothetical protein
VFDWKWDWEICSKCGVRVRLDHATRSKICPKCGEKEEFYPEVWKRHMLVREVLYNYPPGQYLFRDMTLEEVVEQYMRELPEREWFERVAHDYVVARFRHDMERQKFCREVVKELARRMDYDMEWALSLFPMFDDVTKSADFAAFKIFQIARNNLKVDGWRRSEDETVHDAPRQRTLSDEEDLKHSEEWRRWDVYYRGLGSIYDYYWWRKDRVCCWLTRTVYKYVHRELYGTFDAGWCDLDPLLDDEEAMIEGREETRDIIDLFVEDRLRTAEEMYRRDKKYYADNIADNAIRVLAAKLGYDVKKLIGLDFPREVVEEIAEKVGDPEILQLFDDTRLDSKNDPEAARRLLTKVEGMVKVLPTKKVIERANSYVS